MTYKKNPKARRLIKDLNKELVKLEPLEKRSKEEKKIVQKSAKVLAGSHK